MNKMKKIKVILSAVLFVALSGLCSCNDKPQETVTQQPQPGHQPAVETTAKTIENEVPDYIANRGIIIRGEKVEQDRGYYFKSPEKGGAWYYDYVCDCNLSIDTTEEEFAAFLERFSFFDDSPHYIDKDNYSLSRNNGNGVNSYTSFQIVWSSTFREDLSDGGIYFGGDPGHGEPAFYDAEGKYVIFSEMNIPDEVLLVFLEPVMVEVSIETSDNEKEFSSKESETISACIDAMHNLRATKVSMDKEGVLTDSDYILVSFMTQKGMVHDYYVVNDQYLVYGDTVYELSNATDFVKTIEKNVPGLNDGDDNLKAWEDFEEIIGEDKYSSLQKFIPLFDENETFYFYPDNKERSFRDFMDDNEGAWTISNFSLVDMNDDGNDELILYTDFGPGATFVISINDDKYYGKFFTAREMRDIQNNGSFIGSGGEGREYFNKMEISEEKMEYVTFDQKPGSDEENQWTDEYYENYLKENFSDPALEWELNYRVE